MKLISVIIPNYNKGCFISETLDSLINQTYEDWEAIVVDDGSSDESVGIIKKYNQKDSRIKLIERQSKPKGGSACRNIGILNSGGDYIIFLDSDDVFTRTCLENRICAFHKYDNADWLVFSGGTFLEHIGDRKSEWEPPPKGDYLGMFLSHKLPWNITSCMWKREILLLLNGFNVNYPRLQDVEMHTRALMHQDFIVKVIGGLPDFYYRVDEKRKVVDNDEFVDNLVSAVEMYLREMEVYILDSGRSKKYLKALGGTLIMALRTVQYHYDTGKISTEQRNQLFHRLNNTVFCTKLIEIYKLGLLYNVHKIKGYNWFFKKIAIM